LRDVPSFLSIFFYAIASSVRFALCGVGGAILLCGFVFLTRTDQDDARHNFGHSGGISYHHVFVIHKFMSSVGYLIPFN